MVRTIRDPDLLTIWRSALDAMRIADDWIIVGYSLPAEDIAIRSILLRAYHGRGRNGKQPDVRIVLRRPRPENPDTDKRLEDRYRQLFPECQFEYGGFETFIESLPEPEKHYPVF
jgi:hypothetical protein